MVFGVWLSFLFVFNSPPVLAIESAGCLEKSAKLKSTKRTKFLESCIEQVSAPGNVKALEKRERSRECNQNAKNMKLSGQKKASYVEKCVNQNEAAAALRQDEIRQAAKSTRNRKAGQGKSVRSKSKPNSKPKPKSVKTDQTWLGGILKALD